MSIKAITLIQAIWRGHVTRRRFQETMSKLTYVDADDYDYVPVDEREFALAASNLEDFMKPIHNYSVKKSLLELNKVGCDDDDDDVSEVTVSLSAPKTCTPPIASDCKTPCPHQSWSMETFESEVSGTQRPNSPCISYSSVSKTSRTNYPISMVKTISKYFMRRGNCYIIHLCQKPNSYPYVVRSFQNGYLTKLEALNPLLVTNDLNQGLSNLHIVS